MTKALMTNDRKNTLLHHMESSMIAKREDLHGCSNEEIRALEARYALRLPKSYEWYLQTMGHASGRLFTHDHLAVFYKQVLWMTDEYPAEWCEEWAKEGIEPKFALPANALIICGRLGEQFEFIKCIGEEDSAVWFFNASSWQVRQSHASVLDWLEAWCNAAEEAIADGYFEHNSQGTTP